MDLQYNISRSYRRFCKKIKVEEYRQSFNDVLYVISSALLVNAMFSNIQRLGFEFEVDKGMAFRGSLPLSHAHTKVRVPINYRRSALQVKGRQACYKVSGRILPGLASEHAHAAFRFPTGRLARTRGPLLSFHSTHWYSYALSCIYAHRRYSTLFLPCHRFCGLNNKGNVRPTL